MAACSVSELEAQACANGFDVAAEDEVLFRALVLQLLCNISQDSVDFRATMDGELRITEGGDTRTVTL